jgi:tetratricopeptide (TPR) repeat protein
MRKILIIENYLEGSLDQGERHEFEEMLISEKHMAEEIQLHKELNDAIKDDELYLFREKVGEVIRDNSKKTIFLTTLSRKFIKYPVAASIVLLIAISLWQILSFDSPQKLFSTYYEPYLPDISTRSVSTSGDKIQLSCLSYQEGDYEKSFELLQAYLAKNPDNQSASFYLSLSAIELAKYDLAITELKKIENDATSPFAIHAQWYLAMVYLKTNNAADARKNLMQLLKVDNYYSGKAKKILKKLKA